MLQLQTQAERRLEGEKRQKKPRFSHYFPPQAKENKKMPPLKKKKAAFPLGEQPGKKGDKKTKKGLHILGRNKYEAFSNEINASR